MRSFCASASRPRSRPAPSGLGFAPPTWTSRGGPATLMYQTLRQIARVGLRTEKAPTPAPDDVVVQRLHADILRVLGRALALRHVDAGSCNGCELESQALSNPYYNVEGLGIRYVASPRHADALMVTGPVTKNMAVALRRTYDAMPEPKLVIAIGACAIGRG